MSRWTIRKQTSLPQWAHSSNRSCMSTATELRSASLVFLLPACSFRRNGAPRENHRCCQGLLPVSVWGWPMSHLYCNHSLVTNGPRKRQCLTTKLCFQIWPGCSDTPVLASNVLQTGSPPPPPPGPLLPVAPSLSSDFLSHPATQTLPPSLILAAITEGLKMHSKDQEHYWP